MMQIEMPLWVTILGNFGFPITITAYLLFRFEKKVERLSMVVQKLEKTVRKQEKS